MLASAIRSAVIALVLLAFPLSAFAWGQDGHRIVCRIAFLLLDDADQAEVMRLTEAFTGPDGRKYQFFTDGCVFPDDARPKARQGLPEWVRFDQFSNWHFLNVPRATMVIGASACANDCVLHGIDFHANLLKTGATAQARAEALFFLGHWVGDVHQPLHVSYADDLGGNDVKPIRGNFYSSGSLHSVWDSGIVTKARGSVGWLPYANKLHAEVTPVEQANWLVAPPLEWAQESYAVTTARLADYCEWTTTECAREPATGRTLGIVYQREWQETVEERLRQAGARLADVIRQNLR
jgi:S1/P1 Nuclease